MKDNNEEDKEKNNEEKKEDNNEENTQKKEEEKIDEEEEKKDEEKKEEEKEEEKKEKTENEKCLEKYIQDLPFTIYIKKERVYYNDKERIDFIDKENFKKLSKDFKEEIQLDNYNASLDNLNIDLNDYEIRVLFNKESKYINKDTFNLDYFDDYQLDYTIKKEEPKKEGEEEDDGKQTLEKCLKKFIKEEQLSEGDEWYCSKCKKHVLAKKKMDLYYLPKILIICFKRFIKDSSYSWEKNESEVEFPVNNMDMKNFVIGPDKDHSVYDLFAVSQHYGSTGFGHYTAVCKNNGKWFSYNDSSCSETDENDALSSAAYVLFYRRQTD